jgi:hypothetical protein
MGPKANRILLNAIEGVLGPRSEAGRYLSRALDSDDPLDLLLAQAAFDELPAEKRRIIAERVMLMIEADITDEQRQKTGSD